MSNELEGRDLLVAIADMFDQNRPTKWISRSTGVEARYVNAVIHVLGHKSKDVHSLSRYDRAEQMIQDGYSHSEIARTLKCDHRFLTTWFPGSQWPVGGHAEFGGLIRELERQRREFERSGKIQNNRDSGFKLRKDQA